MPKPGKISTSEHSPLAVVDEHVAWIGLKRQKSVTSMLNALRRHERAYEGSRTAVFRRANMSLKERLAKPNLPDIAGLPEAFVAAYYIDTDIRKMMRLEFRLRAADRNRLRSAEALYLLPQALSELADFERRPTATSEYRIAVSSLGIQIYLYLSRAPNLPKKLRFDYLLEARKRAEAIEDECLKVFRGSGDIGMQFQAIRIDCNAIHTEHEIQLLAKECQYDLPSGPLARTKESVARRVSLGEEVFSCIQKVSTHFGDPRIPLNPAEAAGFIGKHHRARALLELAMFIDGHQGKARDWKPKWLPGNYFEETPDLHEAIRLIDGN